LLEADGTTRLDEHFPSQALNLSRKSVTPKGLNQQAYIQAIRNFDLVFGIGPAGTGKTYLAMAMALSYLQDKLVQRIILTRPAVEAGERLGFLPGDLFQKINPYLRPLYDALFDLTPTDQANRLIERGIIEIAPLAFMRGRTLNDSFIILDEAQNTTKEQMKMLLTRSGYDSKVVVTADITQIDLPQPARSGVLQAMKVLARSMKSLSSISTTGTWSATPWSRRSSRPIRRPRPSRSGTHDPLFLQEDQAVQEADDSVQEDLRGSPAPEFHKPEKRPLAARVLENPYIFLFGFVFILAYFISYLPANPFPGQAWGYRHLGHHFAGGPDL